MPPSTRSHVTLRKREILFSCSFGKTGCVVAIAFTKHMLFKICFSIPAPSQSACPHCVCAVVCDQLEGIETRSALVVPLRDSQGQVVGVLSVQNKRKGIFSREDVATLQGPHSFPLTALWPNQPPHFSPNQKYFSFLFPRYQVAIHQGCHSNTAKLFAAVRLSRFSTDGTHACTHCWPRRTLCSGSRRCATSSIRCRVMEP